MKNIQVIDDADNCVYDVFAIADESFTLIFPNGQDIEFIEDVTERLGEDAVLRLLETMWPKRIIKTDVHGIHGTLFYGLKHKKKYYPTKRDEDARNPAGTRLRNKGN
jgi:hypothetical protein